MVCQAIVVQGSRALALTCALSEQFGFTADAYRLPLRGKASWFTTPGPAKPPLTDYKSRQESSGGRTPCIRISKVDALELHLVRLPSLGNSTTTPVWDGQGAIAALRQSCDKADLVSVSTSVGESNALR